MSGQTAPGDPGAVYNPGIGEDRVEGGLSVYDFAVIGGGIVGLSTARALLDRYPGAGVVVLEKEAGWARHQTGHNSGVIHSGIYYKPGSLKARFTGEGGERLVEFCREQGISHEICGKVIVAMELDEMPRLRNLYERGKQNGIEVEKIGPEELGELEPRAIGITALQGPQHGDRGLCRRYRGLRRDSRGKRRRTAHRRGGDGHLRDRRCGGGAHLHRGELSIAGAGELRRVTQR